MATIVVDRSINADNIHNMTAAGTNVNFVALTTGSATYQTNFTGIAAWVTATTVQSSNWQSICYGNNIIVAVSSTSGTIAMTSPQGTSGAANWTLRTLPVTASWYAVAYGLDKFVAVAGGGSTAGAYSPDGAKWTSTGALTTSGDWRAMTFGNDRFVTISYNSTNSNYSTNGTSWTAGGALPATRNWTSITYGEGTFVAVASGSDRGAYSTDYGVTWNEMTMPSSTAWNSVTYGNGTFVAISNTSGTIAAYSGDGITWNSATLPNTRTWVAVAFGNNVFTALASSSTTGAAYSYDGISWGGGALATISLAVSCMCATPTTWNSNDTLVINDNATVTVNTDQKKFWNVMTINNGKLAITNTSTSTGIRFTMGRVTGAAAAAITPALGIGDIEITGNWIELGTGSGSSGQTMTAPFTDYIAALWVETASGSGVYEVWLNATGAYGDTTPVLKEGFAAVGKNARGKFFIQQATSAPYGPTLINGTVGSLLQKLITVTSSTGLYAGASVFGPGIPANTVVNRVISSTQIELNANTTTEVSPDWTSVAYGNSTYVAVSRSYSNIAATSSDGVTWTKRTLPFIADWTSICYGTSSALFVAVAAHGVYGTGYCATSADGITWTQRAMPAVMSWNSVATNGTSYVAVGSTAADAATTVGAYSADGITWTASTMSSAIWRSVTYGAGAANRYVAVSSTTLSNWDADGTGTWTNGGAMTSANYLGIAWNGTRFYAVSGSSTVSMWSTDATSWTTGAVLNNSTSRWVAWDGTNFVIVSTTNSVNTSRTPAGTSGTLTNTTMAAANANNWIGICANGTTLVAVSSSSNLRSAAMTSTDSGANWTLQTGTPLDVSLTCFNPYVSQLSATVEFGDNINGNKVPSGAKVRCPNIMFTSAVPANIQTSSRLVGANMVMTNGGSLTASICLFDESYNTFSQAETLSLTNVGFSLPPVITECYGLTMNSIGFGLEPVRRYYQFSATIGSNLWLTRESRYGSGSTNAWFNINEAVITDFNMVIGQPLSLTANQTGATISGTQAGALTVTSTENSVWTNIRFYGLQTNHNYQKALNLNSLFNNNTITNLETYGLDPFFLGTSNDNTVTNVTFSEDMFNGLKNFPTAAARIGNDPIAGTKLEDNTKYYLKVRSFRNWETRGTGGYFESRVTSATPFLGSKFFPQSLSVVNTGPRTNVVTWVRRDPSAATITYTVFRSTSPSFTRNSTTRLYYTGTVATVSYSNGYVATVTGGAGRTLTFNQAARTIVASTGSFTTDGFVVGANVVVAGTTSNDGTYTIATVAATTLTLATNHTNLVNEGPISTGTLNGEPPVNGTTYYYRLIKNDFSNASITNAAGTAAGTTLTIPSGSFNTGIGTVINCEGISGQTKVRLPLGSTTSFHANNIAPGMQISGGGIGASATVVSIDTPWQITVSVANSSTFVGQTLSLGAAAGMYIYGPGIAWPTKVVSVDSATSITVDTAFLATFSGQTITFFYGTESEEFEVYTHGQTNPYFNFLTQTDNFNNAAWTKTNMTVTVDQKTEPLDLNFGSNLTLALTADRLVSTGPLARAEQTITNLKSGSAYNFSVYIITDVQAQVQTVAGEISIDTTSPTTQAFTANGVWQRISTNFTATSATHTFKVQITTQGAWIYAGSANVVPGSSVLAPVTNTTLKTAAGSGGRTLTFASSGTVHTITASSGSFTTDGFVNGDSIIVYGTSSNDGTYLVTTVAATVLTINTAQPLVAEGPISVGTIIGSVLAAAAQEITLAAAWNRSLGGNTANQGIELTLATAPAGYHYSEIYLGTASNFTPSDLNRVAYVGMPGSQAVFSLLNSAGNRVDTVDQEGYGGITGPLITLSGSSNNEFFDFTVDFNFAFFTGVTSFLTIAGLSNNNILDDFTVKGWRNYIASWTPYTLVNLASGLTLQNISFDNYDFPIYTTNLIASLGVVMKGVSGGHFNQITAITATTYTLGSTLDSLGIAFQAVYDTIFHEIFDSPTTGKLALRFNASAEDSPPYVTIAGSPAFSNTGRLYLRTAGDSIEYTWPHRIYTVSGFRDLPVQLSGADLGTTPSSGASGAILQGLLVEYKIDTGSGYGAYKTATPANLASESVSTATGFLMKIKITARPGMLFSTQTNAFVATEVIEGATSGATATVDEVYNLTTTTGVIVLSSVSGTFLPGELVRRASDDQSRATNVATNNAQDALFPSFASYIDGLEIFTNTVGPGDYPGQTVSITLTNVVTDSTYYVYKTSGGTLLGSGTATSSTVTIPDVAYVANFDVTVRVRKSSAVTKYLPFETQSTVNSAGASVFTAQVADSIVATSYGSIGSDFTINYTYKKIYHSSGSTVYSVNALYSYLQDTFDDVAQLDDTVPMSAQTPTEYTLINGWYIDDESMKYLTGGAIQTSGWTGGVIRLKPYNATGAGVAFGSSDIGKVITETDSGDTGIILAYDERTATEIGYVWIRPDTLSDTFADVNSAYTVATSSAAGVFTAASTSGENLWSNIFSLGTIVSGTTLDVWQNDAQITPWWTSGQIDILVKVKEMGTEIDTGNVTVLARKYSTLYDHFVIDASTGRNPVPLAAFTDANNQTASGTVAGYSDITITFGASSHDLGNGNGAQPYDVDINCAGRTLTQVYEYLKYVTRTGSGTTLNGVNGEFYTAVGDIRLNYTGESSGPFVQGNAITSSAGGSGYIVSLIDNGTTGTLVIRNVHGTFANTNTLTSSGTTATISGVPDSITPSKQAPFGTFAGGNFFGARGVYIYNMHASDANSYELIDSTNTSQVPPATISVAVNGVVSGDRVSVFRTTGDNEIIDKDYLHSHATNNSAATTAWETHASTPIPADTPTAGFIRLVKVATNTEERIAYSSWTGNVFTLGSSHAGGYSGSDRAYVPYIDEQASSTSVSKSVTYVTDRYVLTRVRLKGIQPFNVKGQVTSSGYSATAVRTTDSIA